MSGHVCTGCGAELSKAPTAYDWTDVWCNACWLADEAEVLPDERRIVVIPSVAEVSG